MNGADFMNPAGGIENTFGDGGFAGIDVGNCTDVSDVSKGVLSHNYIYFKMNNFQLSIVNFQVWSRAAIISIRRKATP
jgi:hypothetical protein